jgi:hypothetical protein
VIIHWSLLPTGQAEIEPFDCSLFISPPVLPRRSKMLLISLGSSCVTLLPLRFGQLSILLCSKQAKTAQHSGPPQLRQVKLRVPPYLNSRMVRSVFCSSQSGRGEWYPLLWLPVLFKGVKSAHQLCLPEWFP